MAHPPATSASLLAVLLCGCVVAPPRPPADVVTPPVAEASAAPSQIDAMQKQMICLGPCPPFDLGPSSDVELSLSRWGLPVRIAVSSDGTVVFEGAGPKVHGRVVEQIPRLDAQRLIQRFEHAGATFDAFGHSAPLCAGLMTHQPLTSVASLVRGTRKLTIYHYACEGTRFPLADEIERVTRAERWARCTEGTLPSCGEP